MNIEIRNKCRNLGPEALTDTELLSLLLRSNTETADTLLMLHDGSRNIGNLMKLSGSELLDVKGIGPNAAIELDCIRELSKRMWNVPMERPSAKSPSEVARHFSDMRFLDREELRIAFLDLRCRIASEMTMTIGTVNSSLVNVREILIEALKRKAMGIIIVHNHPSGEPLPSDADISVTEKLNDGANAIGIKLYDHVIIGENGFYSFREKGGLGNW